MRRVLDRSSKVQSAEVLICAALRGESPAWPWADDAQAIAEFLQRTDLHGVNALLHGAATATAWPAALANTLRDKALQLAMWELRHQQVLIEALAQLDLIGIRPILIKGTALAYQLYPDPALRTRGDTDLIIPPEARAQVHEALLSLGFERSLGVSGELVSYQASYTLHTATGGAHTLDLHWQINNSELLSRLFSYDELRQGAQPLPRLSPQALAAGPVHALLLACVHRATHRQNPYYVDEQAHHDPDRLIWLHDIHLLATRMPESEWLQLLQLAAHKGLRAVCLDGMRQAQACFQTPYPAAVLAGLARKGPEEAADRYLNGGKLRQLWMDFAALGSIARQLQWLRESFFPCPAYMQRRYPDPWLRWLPWLYLRRAANGFAKRLVRGGRDA